MTFADITMWLLSNDESQYEGNYVPTPGVDYYIDAWARCGFIAEAAA